MLILELKCWENGGKRSVQSIHTIFAVDLILWFKSRGMVPRPKMRPSVQGMFFISQKHRWSMWLLVIYRFVFSVSRFYMASGRHKFGYHKLGCIETETIHFWDGSIISSNTHMLPESKIISHAGFSPSKNPD